jgi:hypothetical protein
LLDFRTLATSGLTDKVKSFWEFRPFTATRKDQYWTESRRYDEINLTFARARNGSFALMFDAKAPDHSKQSPPLRSEYLFNVPRRWYIHAEAFTRTAVVLPIVDDTEMDRLTLDNGSCAGLSDGTWKSLGKSSMLGLPVIEVEVEKTDRSVTKEWVAPDLQCYALKRTYVEDDELRTKIEVVSIDLKEPEPKVFEPPAGYELVSPLEMENRYRVKFPGHELMGLSAYKLEEQYQLAVDSVKKKQ